MIDVAFLITTYGRQESCQRLVDSLQGLGDIVVMSDGAGYNIEGCRMYEQPHRGREGYWHTVSHLWSKRETHRYYIMLPDDFKVVPSFLSESLRLWSEIRDAKKICLNLHADRIGIPCWTNFKPQDMGEVYLTQWVDMCFLAENRFFEVLEPVFYQHRNYRVKRSWKSSGIGGFISRTLHRSGYHLYQVKKSLAEITEEHWNSQMKAQ